MTIDQAAGTDPARTWTGHTPGTSDYVRLLAALFCAGVKSTDVVYELVV